MAVGAYSKKDKRKLVQPTLTGFETGSVLLDGTTTEETIELACPASKITLQANGDLNFTYTVSVNGETFASGAAAIAAGTLSSYNTHLVSSIKITRNSGSGKVSIAAVS